jgi:drug/metabolite transporter (DMT)-like permease
VVEHRPCPGRGRRRRTARHRRDASRICKRSARRERERQQQQERQTDLGAAGVAGRSTLAGGALNLGGPAYGLLSAFSWGAGDFGGGLISRYSSVFTAIVTSEAIGLVGGLLLALFVGEPFPSSQSTAWALAAGGAGVVGLGAFYYALSRGTMGVVAPLTAVIGAALPVAVGVATGDEIDLLRVLGFLTALLAVVLISLSGGERTTDDKRRMRIDLRQLPYAIVSGIGFGLFFVALNQSTAAGGAWWATVLVRAAGLILVALAIVFAISRSRERTLRRRTDVVLGLPNLRARSVPALQLGGLFLMTGLGDLGGNIFFILASQADALSVAVVLASLYPVVTTVLAAIFLHERLRRVQILGVVLASLSVPLLR